FDLVHDVEVGAALPQEKVDVGERLEPCAELRGGLADALGDRPDLAVPLGQEHDDAVGLTQAIAAQDHALVAEEAHNGGTGISSVAAVRAGWPERGRWWPPGRLGRRDRAGNSARRSSPPRR